MKITGIYCLHKLFLPVIATLGMLLLAGSCFHALAQQGESISGTVADSLSGSPLPGVSVMVAETGEGVSTAADGSFNLEVAEASVTLEIAFLGYATKRISVRGGTAGLRILLAPDAESLDEVVVIGYGSQKKKDITGAIASMDAEKLQERPISRVDQALVGQMAGVRVQQTSGVPGKGFSIQVRGTGSITANNQPLYVIDGFPLEVSDQNSGGGFSRGNPLDNINPSDIASIQVLKDASAAAIYGSRASNGVVIITTKSGRLGKPRITYNAHVGWNETAKKLDVLSGPEWIDRAMEMINDSWVNSGPGRTADQSTAERVAINGSFDRNLMIDERWLQDGYPGLRIVDWQDELFRRGLVHSHQVSATGGNDFVKYYISGNYLDQEGIALGVGHKRYTARANVEVTASDKVRFGLNISPSYSIINDPGVEGKDNEMHVTVGMVPVTEDSVVLDVNVGDNPPYLWGNSRSSPIRVVENSIGETKLYRTLASLFGEYTILEGLSLKSTLNLDNTDADIKSFRPSFISGSVGNRQASGTFSGYRRQTFVNENTISFDRSFSEHHLSLLAGLSYNLSKFDDFRIRSADGFISDDISTINGANNINVGSTYTRETKNILLSYFGRVQYDYLGRYLVSASIRRDGSSRFGRDTKWGVFPSASLGWRISDEDFLRDASWLEELKLRASWGISGNNGLGGDYEHIALLGIDDYTFGGAQSSGLVPSNFPNPNLGWEESETINLGFDMGLLRNRIFASFDYYTKRNTNLLLSIPVPSATGFSSALTNIGEVLNKGWELELTGRIFTGDFQWTANANLSYNQNEVVKLGPDNAPILGGEFDINHNILTVGEPMYSIYVVQQIGILSQQDIDAGAALYGEQEEGDPRYLDANGDGVISPDDRVLSGHPNPDYIWGFSNTFSYKGFDLSVLVQGQWGGKIYSLFGRAMDRTGQGFPENTLGLQRDRWRSPENPGAGERGKATSRFGRIKNTDWLYSSDYWRIRNITLGYNLGRWINSSVIQNARIYLTAENWWGGDKYAGGFNPEAINTNGDDYGAFPLPKSMILGLDVTF